LLRALLDMLLLPENGQGTIQVTSVTRVGSMALSDW
jgi:hypothetical protein